MTEGIDALGEVTVRIRPEREPAGAQREDGRVRVFNGHGADTDILVAAAKAYLAAINRMLAGDTLAPRSHHAAETPSHGARDVQEGT